MDLYAVLHGAMELARPVIEGKGHRLSVTPPPQPICIEADATPLAQIVDNLLNNAAKYTDPGGEIALSAALEGDMAVIRVRDNGVGIAPDFLPRVFDLFAQADSSLDRAQGGLGIGLSMVKSLVELHGGRVETASAGLGHGSEFKVLLPVVEPAAPPLGDRPPELPQRALRILVVDDNRDAAESLGELLQLAGHEVQCVYDGPAALAAARSFDAQLVLLDIGLPGMHGFEVARRLRVGDAPGRPTIITLGGYGQDEDRQASKDAGCAGHLVKPVDPRALFAAIHAAGPPG